MIVPMHKVTLLCLAAARDEALQALRALGILHLEPVREPEASDLDAAQRALARCEAAIAQLQSQRPPEAPAAAPALTPQAMIERTEELSAALRRCEEQIPALDADIAALAPLGEIDPAALAELRRDGVHVSFWRLPRRQAPAAPAGAVLAPLGADASFRYYALIGREPAALPDALAVPAPDRRLSAWRAELAARRASRAATARALQELAAGLPALRAHRAALAAELQFCQARAGMAEAGPVAYLQGFCPVDALPALQDAARRHGWGLLAQTPAEDDRVPTLIRNPSWIRPIRFLFDLIGVTPGYREADISAAFLIFYSVFFAILVGDAGYGLLFLALTALLRFLFPRAPRDLARLLALLSVCTIAWGVLTGNYFGIATLPPLLQAARVEWLRDERNVMALCFLLGAIHLTVAHVWNALRTLNSLTALAQLGWIGMTWTMYFMAGNMILDRPLPPWLLWLFLPALAAIVLFMTPFKALKNEWPNHVMLPLTIINNFGDVVSYVRLFAVGSAGAAISVAFNEMAVGAGLDSVAAGAAAALILFGAHSLNILLCALGVIVHGVRLNTLEFCGHMGIQWTGFKYQPFALDPAAAAPQPGVPAARNHGA